MTVSVLVVDDSVVCRRVLNDALSSDPALEVVGTAANGKIALAKVEQLRPDLLVLDVEMPEMDGLETLRALKRRTPTPRVVMFSTHTQAQARTTIEALILGVEACVAKGSGLHGSKDASPALKESVALTMGHGAGGLRPPDRPLHSPPSSCASVETSPAEPLYVMKIRDSPHSPDVEQNPPGRFPGRGE